MAGLLFERYPGLAYCIDRLALADLPTPVERHALVIPAGQRQVFVKRDDLTSLRYGGNKVRKLEFLLWRARQKGATRIVTFGAVGSHHALATAIHARAEGFDCTCFLAHQEPVAGIAKTLNMHRRVGTTLVPWRGGIDDALRACSPARDEKRYFVPLGGSSWLGALGHVEAAFEFDAQWRATNLPCPSRLYVANGTMATAAGLALGLAAAGLPTVVHAVRVADNRFSSPEALTRLLQRTAKLLNRLDPTFDSRIADRVRIEWRDEFFAGGYAIADRRTIDAVHLAREQIGLQLEGTYTGKAFAALLHDLATSASGDGDWLFWNTHNSAPLPVDTTRPTDAGDLPQEFLRYFD